MLTVIVDSQMSRVIRKSAVSAVSSCSDWMLILLILITLELEQSVPLNCGPCQKASWIRV